MVDLIISLTSYPNRIKIVKDALLALTQQAVPVDFTYKIVFVLAEPEFPNKEEDLPEDLLSVIHENNIELIWHPRNILSHKKLMPTIKKYPKTPILITDDDIVRPKYWLMQFWEEHIRHPQDIICGMFCYSLDENGEMIRFDDYKRKGANPINGVGGCVFNFARPANGSGGVLYPKGCFKDKRFFDEDLMMSLSPTSDESWQFLFNILEDRTIRQTPTVVDAATQTINGSQLSPTCLHKRNNYNRITKTLMSAFPEFKEKLNERQKKIIVALASYKERILNGSCETAIESILRQSMKPSKIVLTIPRGHKKFLTPKLKGWIDKNIVELIIASKDMGPHNKYFYVMQKYREYAVITIDDDFIYDVDLVRSLCDSYIKYPNCISARRAHLMNLTNGRLTNYEDWGYEYSGQSEPSYQLMATGGGGTLYPPDILCIHGTTNEPIGEFRYVDDIYLKLKELKRGIRIVFVRGNAPWGSEIPTKENRENALYKKNCQRGGGNDKAIDVLNKNYSFLFQKYIPNPIFVAKEMMRRYKKKNNTAAIIRRARRRISIFTK